MNLFGNVKNNYKFKNSKKQLKSYLGAFQGLKRCVFNIVREDSDYDILLFDGIAFKLNGSSLYVGVVDSFYSSDEFDSYYKKALKIISKLIDNKISKEFILIVWWDPFSDFFTKKSCNKLIDDKSIEFEKQQVSSVCGLLISLDDSFKFKPNLWIGINVNLLTHNRQDDIVVFDYGLSKEKYFKQIESSWNVNTYNLFYENFSVEKKTILFKFIILNNIRHFFQFVNCSNYDNKIINDYANALIFDFKDVDDSLNPLDDNVAKISSKINSKKDYSCFMHKSKYYFLQLRNKIILSVTVLLLFIALFFVYSKRTESIEIEQLNQKDRFDNALYSTLLKSQECLKNSLGDNQHFKLCLDSLVDVYDNIIEINNVDLKAKLNLLSLEYIEYSKKTKFSFQDLDFYKNIKLTSDSISLSYMPEFYKSIIKLREKTCLDLGVDNNICNDKFFFSKKTMLAKWVNLYLSLDFYTSDSLSKYPDIDRHTYYKDFWKSFKVNAIILDEMIRFPMQSYLILDSIDYPTSITKSLKEPLNHYAKVESDELKKFKILINNVKDDLINPDVKIKLLLKNYCFKSSKSSLYKLENYIKVLNETDNNSVDYWLRQLFLKAIKVTVRDLYKDEIIRVDSLYYINVYSNFKKNFSTKYPFDLNSLYNISATDLIKFYTDEGDFGIWLAYADFIIKKENNKLGILDIPRSFDFIDCKSIKKLNNVLKKYEILVDEKSKVLSSWSWLLEIEAEEHHSDMNIFWSDPISPLKLILNSKQSSVSNRVHWPSNNLTNSGLYQLKIWQDSSTTSVYEPISSLDSWEFYRWLWKDNYVKLRRKSFVKKFYFNNGSFLIPLKLCFKSMKSNNPWIDKDFFDWNLSSSIVKINKNNNN